METDIVMQVAGGLGVKIRPLMDGNKINVGLKETTDVLKSDH